MEVFRYNRNISGLAVIFILFLNAELFRNYLIEMLKFKKITREGKLQKLVEIWELLAWPVYHCKACNQ